MRRDVRHAARSIDAYVGVEVKFDARIKIEINIDTESTLTRSRIFREPGGALAREGFTKQRSLASLTEIITIRERRLAHCLCWCAIAFVAAARLIARNGSRGNESRARGEASAAPRREAARFGCGNREPGAHAFDFARHDPRGRPS